MNDVQIEARFSKALEARIEEGFEIYLEENSIPRKMVGNEVVSRIYLEQRDLTFPDFLMENESITEENIEDKVGVYIDQNFDDSYLINQFEQVVDEDELRSNLSEELVLSLINTEPYGAISRTEWTEKVRKVSNLKELAIYVETNDLNLFVEKYSPDFESKINEGSDEKVSSNEVKNVFLPLLQNKANDAYERFLTEEGLVGLPISDQSRVVNVIAEEQANFTIEEFLNDSDGLNQSNLAELAKDYIEENFDSDHLLVQVEKHINYDQIREELTDEFLLILTNTDPYGLAPTSFWNSKLQSIPLNKITDFVKSENIAEFVEQYAPEWEEVAKENV